MIVAALALMAALALPAIGRKREEVFVDEED
jgi:hypothetical protein